MWFVMHCAVVYVNMSFCISMEDFYFPSCMQVNLPYTLHIRDIFDPED